MPELYDDVNHARSPVTSATFAKLTRSRNIRRIPESEFDKPEVRSSNFMAAAARFAETSEANPLNPSGRIRDTASALFADGGQRRVGAASRDGQSRHGYRSVRWMAPRSEMAANLRGPCEGCWIAMSPTQSGHCDEPPTVVASRLLTTPIRRESRKPPEYGRQARISLHFARQLIRHSSAAVRSQTQPDRGAR